MHLVPSSDLLLLTRTHVTSFYGGSFFHRLKLLQKSDRRAVGPIQALLSAAVSGPSTDLDIEMQTNGFDLFAGDNNKCNVAKDYEQGDSDNRKTRNPTYEECFRSTVTLLAAESINEKGWKSLQPSELNESAEIVNEGNLQSTLLPADAILSGNPLKLVSALKGSREKKIIAPKRLSVTWAPDVYESTPTSVSHALSSRNQPGKKYGKNKNKGRSKSSRGSKCKDKKQARKSGGGMSKSKPLRTMTTV